MKNIKRIFVGKWSLEDDSSCQYVRKVDGCEGTFDLIEMCLINPDTNEHEVYTDTICAEKDMGKEELISILDAFGYAGHADVRKQYGSEAEQIMAECVFEYYSNNRAKTLFCGSAEDCTKFIKDYCSKF